MSPVHATDVWIAVGVAAPACLGATPPPVQTVSRLHESTSHVCTRPHVDQSPVRVCAYGTRVLVPLALALPTRLFAAVLRLFVVERK